VDVHRLRARRAFTGLLYSSPAKNN